MSETSETASSETASSETASSGMASSGMASSGMASSGMASSGMASSGAPDDDAAPESAARDALAATLTAAGLGTIACLGVGLARDDGPEPWLANGLALALTAGGLRLGGLRLDGARAAMKEAVARSTPWSARATGLALFALALAAAHALVWAPFDTRLWPLGLAAGAAAAASVIASGLGYSARADVPRWSGAPTPLLLLALAGASGLLCLSAVENLLGFPPGLVVWKAALALIGAALAAQLWTAQAAEASRAAAEAGGLRGPLFEGEPYSRARRMARTLWFAAIGLGLGVPVVCAIGADFFAGRFWMPVALVSHLAGAAAMRLLLHAEAERAVAPSPPEETAAT